MPQVVKSRPPSGAKRGKKRKHPDADVAVVVRRDELWVCKHAPKVVADLVVHKKKVSDVRSWLESRLRGGGVAGGKMLLVTGPAGVGKSATVAVLGRELGIRFSEWKAPAPTPWQEHLHQGFTGHRYTSKLDEFEGFVEGARKFPALGTSSENVKAVLIEDLPHVSDGAQTQQLCRVLQELARSVCFITVVVVTEGADEVRSAWRDAVVAMEAAGATKIAFNLVTPPAIKRLLTKIAATERCRLATDAISAIAENCRGDLRHAISSLEFHSTKHQRKDTSDSASSPAYGRDNVFSHYHALGKFLHNKRHADQPLEGGGGGVHPRFLRHPLNMEVPEQILAEAQIEFPTLVSFLHENVLDFIDEDAIDDVAEVLTYLGDADIQLSRSFSTSFSDGVWSVNVAGLAAGSVAARGMLFGNAHPAPRKWQSVRAPVFWQVERIVAKKESTMQLSREAPSRGGSPSEDEPMDDLGSLTADCIVDLDDDEMVPRSNSRVQIDRGPSNSGLEDHMDEDEDVIEDYDDDDL